MELSKQQTEALNAAVEWFTNHRTDQQVFKLRGYAGSGKTTLEIEIAKALKVEKRINHFGEIKEVYERPARVGYAAFTGKAALVMQKKGCVGAQTIHSLIYSVEEVDELDPKTGQPTGQTVPSFILNLEGSPLCTLDCLIIDECSMVDEELAQDLLAFGKPIIAVGDPGQLPPISGNGYFDKGAADFTLTEIHRQALDNPIIRMSMDVRSGKGIKRGAYGQSQVINKAQITNEMLLAHDQILCGRNATRRTFNKRIRELKGFTEPNAPMQGEKLICLRNDREKGLLNGSLWMVDTVPVFDGKAFEMRLTSLDMEGCKANVKIYKEFFSDDEDILKRCASWRCDQFDWAYAMTVHKSQGSQWSTGLIYNENFCFRENAVRWLYTAVTRMSDSLTLAL